MCLYGTMLWVILVLYMKGINAPVEGSQGALRMSMDEKLGNL